jgi:hypothetical protein
MIKQQLITLVWLSKKESLNKIIVQASKVRDQEITPASLP